MSRKGVKLTAEEKKFWDAVDMFIDAANAAAEDCDTGVIASAVMYATARYCAFNLANYSESRKDFLADTDEVIAHISSQFKELLEENMADYGENYKTYMGDKV